MRSNPQGADSYEELLAQSMLARSADNVVNGD